MNSAILMFEESVKKFGGKIAIKDNSREISFNKLREVSLKLGTSLISHVKENDSITPLIVLMPKSIEAVSLFLGSMYAGTPYVPVDYNIPLVRLEKILNTMEEAVIVSNEEGINRLENLDLKKVKLLNYNDLINVKENEELLLENVNKIIDTDPIYIMFTSGSTGDPKGVTIPHRGIIDYANWLKETFGFNEDTILGNQAQFYFDNSTFDIYTMCLTGAKMVIIPEILFKFPNKLMEYVESEKINSILWVPTVIISVANSQVLETRKWTSLKTILFCGEQAPSKQVNQWRKNIPDAVYGNLYGPTEITDVCSYYILDKDFEDSQLIPIGKPCKNMRIYILTKDNKLAKKGEIGFLHVAGSGVSRGYWNRPSLTKKAFIQNPLISSYDDRLYNTGDLAYIGEDNNIYFVGRKDSQIKHRGNRIELGEIETAAKSFNGVKNAVVIYDEDSDNIILVLESSKEFKLRKVNMELKKILPPYMVATRLEVMESLPKTGNGKIDRVYLKKYLKEN